MKKNPLISFCIATYKRPEFIKSTIKTILSQKYDNVEIVISEDDSEESSENVVKQFNSKKIIYHKNKTRLGMVKSFNKAFTLSKGAFVTILADDDPPTKNMLEIFSKALTRYPNAKAFWGGSFVNITSKKIEKVNHLSQGLNSLVNKNKKYGKTEILKPKQFFKQFFKQEIFPHYLWNASLISRELVNEIKGVPDYDSAHFSDYAYLLKIASKHEFVIINKELAIFNLHELNYGRNKDTLEEYKRGVIGFDKTISKIAEKLGSKKEYEDFLSEYIIMFLVNRLEHYRVHGIKINSMELFNQYKDLSKKLPFLDRRKNELFIKLNIYYKYGHLFNFINISRKKYGSLKESSRKFIAG